MSLPNFRDPSMPDYANPEREDLPPRTIVPTPNGDLAITVPRDLQERNPYAATSQAHLTTPRPKGKIKPMTAKAWLKLALHKGYDRDDLRVPHGPIAADGYRGEDVPF
jgi:hypothetical protein